MRNKTISISEGLYDLLQNEENASKLIDTLLWDYYNSIEKIQKPAEELIDPITIMNKSIQKQQWMKEGEELRAIIEETKKKELEKELNDRQNKR